VVTAAISFLVQSEESLPAEGVVISGTKVLEALLGRMPTEDAEAHLGQVEEALGYDVRASEEVIRCTHRYACDLDDASALLSWALPSFPGRDVAVVSVTWLYSTKHPAGVSLGGDTVPVQLERRDGKWVVSGLGVREHFQMGPGRPGVPSLPRHPGHPVIGVREVLTESGRPQLVRGKNSELRHAGGR
jgi:hypothetical protein